jgi:uncharacterized protein YcfJ
MYARRLAAALGIVVLAACSGNDTPPMDASLSGDLALASSSQPYQQQQFMSPTEQAYAGGYARPVSSRGGYSQPAARPPARTTSRSTSTSSGSGEIVHRNTKRDAVIGATAGAVIGASTSRNKTKGAIIGAAAGAVLGGIVGHTVDVDRQ